MKHRFDQAEKRISKFENRSFELILDRETKIKRIKRVKKGQMDAETTPEEAT